MKDDTVLSRISAYVTALASYEQGGLFGLLVCGFGGLEIRNTKRLEEDEEVVVRGAGRVGDWSVDGRGERGREGLITSTLQKVSSTGLNVALKSKFVTGCRSCAHG